MKYSLVIPNYNGSKLLENNLPKVIKTAKNSEIIVVDDASTDNSIEIVEEKFPQVKLVKHKENLRFARACNSGVTAARGEIIVLLNTDLYPEENFLERLGPHFKDEKVFAVGCLEIVDSQKRGKSTGKFNKGLLVHSQASNMKPGPTLWAFGGSAAFRKDMWIKLGGMDPLYHPAYWEDIDLSYRAWKRGWKVLFEPSSRVHHQPESTNLSVFGEDRIKRIASKNQILFVWKNVQDQDLVLEHFIWLPLRLIYALAKSDGAFLKGTLQAFTQLPQALKKRKTEKKERKLKDRQVLEIFEG